MSPAPRDLMKPLAWGYDGYLVRQVPLAIGLAALGLTVLLLVDGEGSRDREAIFAGWILIAASLGYVGYVLYLRVRPRAPVFLVSPAGIRYRIYARKEVLIPWSEIAGVDSIDFTRFDRSHPWPTRYRDVTVVLISKRFYDARIDPKSLLWSGSSWRLLFIPKGDQVQVTLLHSLLTLPPETVRAEVETRWRAFSSHPNAKLPPTPKPPRAPDLLDRLTLPTDVKRVLLVLLALIALPLAYYWQWGWAWRSFSVPDGARSAYLDQLLGGRGVAARLADGRMASIRRDDLARNDAIACTREIVRDPARDGWTPAYTASATCTVGLTLTSGAPAIGLFQLVAVDASWEDLSGKRHPASAIVPAPLTLDEAGARLCALGHCAPAADAAGGP